MKFPTCARLVLPLLGTAVAVHIKPIDGNGRLGSPGKILTQDTKNSNRAAANPNEGRILQVPTLNYVGDEGIPATAFPLGRCEGDCDNDNDCTGTLICFQRKPGSDVEIPGCDGTPEAGTDYCYEYPSIGGSNAMDVADEPELFKRDENVLPISTAALTLCEGDCDHSGECAGSLRCFQRGGTERVPGCKGTGTAGMDYCYDPNSFTGLTIGIISTATASPTAPPATPLPTVPPSASAVIAPTAPGVLTLVGNGGNPASGFPLGICEGDCDSDIDCKGSLVCFQRGSAMNNIVPGCSGDPMGNWDYCVASVSGPASTLPPTSLPTTPSPTPIPTTDPPTPAPTATDPPTPAPTATDPPTPIPVTPVPTAVYTSTPELSVQGNNGSPAAAFPLQVCQADCDDDNDCTGTLLCYQRDADDTEAIPGCVGEPDKNKDYCYDPGLSGTISTNPPTPGPTTAPLQTSSPASTPALVLLGNNGNPPSVFPLSLCEGDCDNDGECEGSLECFQRRDTTPIPGCSGSGTSNRDYVSVCLFL